MEKRMAQIAPRSFKGTRDFTPREMIPREKIINDIKTVFKLYGFSPLETPALEMLQVLAGKYGEEGDKLLYKLDYKNDKPKDRVALRYDLTVPLARVVANHPEWPMPFKRFQIQPVWRADKPQVRQGRFREFCQCDVDTIGSPEGIADAEIIALSIDTVIKLGFDSGDKKAQIQLNHRKILAGLCEYVGRPSSELALFCRALDKLDKIGMDGVKKELEKIGVDDVGFQKLDKAIAVEGSNNEKLVKLRDLLKDNQAACEGIDSLSKIIEYIEILGISEEFTNFNPTLARGLDYYTGVVFETTLPGQPHIGSLTGGGRYDNLIELYSGRDLPAIGTTIGLDRIFAAMEQLGMINSDTATVTEILFAAYSKDEVNTSLSMVKMLRDAGISAELFPSTGKLKKPFGYADKLKIPYVAVVGPDEIADKDNLKLTLKDLKKGEQETVTVSEAIKRIKG
jgi:histidyl-tRNA synthetase